MKELPPIPIIRPKGEQWCAWCARTLMNQEIEMRHTICGICRARADFHKVWVERAVDDAWERNR